MARRPMMIRAAAATLLSAVVVIVAATGVVALGAVGSWRPTSAPLPGYITSVVASPVVEPASVPLSAGPLDPGPSEVAADVLSWPVTIPIDVSVTEHSSRLQPSPADVVASLPLSAPASSPHPTSASAPDIKPHPIQVRMRPA